MATTTKSKKSAATSKAKPASASAGTKKVERVSRAVTRDVEAGSTVDCEHCGDRVKFQAKVRHKQVICNVYSKNTWVRVEHYHADCYETADSPYGTPEAAIDYRRRGSQPKPAASNKS